MWQHDTIIRKYTSGWPKSEAAEIEELRSFIGAIGEASGTDEKGRDLIEVARNAHRAEQELAAIKRKIQACVDDNNGVSVQ